ncbi:MAG: DUF4912 domain-containing protein [Chitinivibrionales bacterium]|nr:DUF4912 domain-containing protein [Chitinivibrionales bacterium]MBD3356167.1 DUF4912 domain-containing protein [Chitinivibrionales bacterium]
MTTRGAGSEKPGKAASEIGLGADELGRGAEGRVEVITPAGEIHSATSGGHRREGGAIPQADSALPDGYGDNHVYIMVRDPHWLFSYWEIQIGRWNEVLGQLGGSWDSVSTILRVYDVTEQTTSFDISLPPGLRNWYINVSPNRGYYVEIGLLHKDGRFIALARSNTVVTPRAGMSDIIDEQWMGIDFEAMYALSGGFEAGRSSAELQKMMEERLQKAVSSGSGAAGVGGAVSSISSPVKIPKRGFWFVLDCELIVYGATEPDAKVTLQGKEVKLRPDGTFSLRFALPDGHYNLDATAESADGIEKRTIVPVVTRTTHTPEPIVLSDTDVELQSAS